MSLLGCGECNFNANRRFVVTQWVHSRASGKQKKTFAVASFTKATKTMFGTHSWTRKLL
jgi:hypothetical protein